MHTSKSKDFSGIKNNGSLPSPLDVEMAGDRLDLLNDYMDSAASLLTELEAAALEYEDGRNLQENAETIRRVLHKLKGESGMAGIDDICKLCHQAESAFEQLSENRRTDMLLRFTDWTDAALQHLAQAGPA